MEEKLLSLGYFCLITISDLRLQRSIVSEDECKEKRFRLAAGSSAENRR